MDNYLDNSYSQNYYCSLKQLLIIIIPIIVVVLFAAIFIPVYVMHEKNKEENQIINNNYYEYDGYEEYEENIVNYTYAILTPKNGYDHILFFLGGIGDISTKYFSFFKSKNTFVPRGTKIYFISGQFSLMQFSLTDQPVPGWFNIAANASLMPTEYDFTQARESLNIVLDEIDRIKTLENVGYDKIYLSGFSQGAMMTNYVLLNSRHKLGGYIAFSGYVFDHDFLENRVLEEQEMTPARKQKLEDRKDYHILATHSFEDNAVFYDLAAPSYRTYYKEYTDFTLLSFGNLDHKLPEQPIHHFVRKWLRASMGK